MKRILYIVIIILMLILPVSNISAQQNVNLSPYIGTWKYTNISTKEELIIKLRETTYTNPYGQTGQRLVGTYIYIKYDQTIHDNSSQFMSDLSAIQMPIFASAGVDSEPNPTRLILYVKDYGKMKNGLPKTSEGWLILVSSSNPRQIRWQVEEPEGLYIAGSAPPLGFSFPTDVIFTKVEENENDRSKDKDTKDSKDDKDSKGVR